MSSALAQQAARLANGNGPARQDEVPVPTPGQLMGQDTTEDEFDELADGHYPTPEQVKVHVAWHRVMCDVRAIAKNRRVTEGKAKFAFRGVEDVVQAFAGPLRRHGVIVAPTAVTTSYTSSTSKSGTGMRECTATVSWAVIGPMGDVLPVPLASAGEGMDYQDKATAKAEAIALRWFLTTLGMVPTGDPEPEAESAQIERGNSSSPHVHAYYAEITDPGTSFERFRQIYHELDKHQLVPSMVEHQGQRTSLGALYMRVRNERWPRQQPQQSGAPAHRDHPEGEWMDGCEGCIAESRAMDQQAAGGDA